MFKYFFIVVFFYCSIAVCQDTRSISGLITDVSGKPVSFASVYIKGSNMSTMANENGYYKLNAAPGEYTLIFRFVGYKSLEMQINVKNSLKLDIGLQKEIYTLDEVTITQTNEDPANEIIRNIISKRKYLRATPSYECDVYTKGVQKLISAPKRIMGENVEKALHLDTNRRGILYQSETLSKLYFKYPNRKEIMLASKVAGDKQGFSFNRASDLQINFYDNTIQWTALGNQKFVSPVADNAFHYYDFQLIGTIVENGHEVEKIKVTPKGKYVPAFKGYIYVLKGDGRLYSVDLYLTEQSKINFVDTLHISQHYNEVQKAYWVPSDITITFKGKVLGFTFAGYFTGLYSNYIPNPSFASNFFGDEIIRIDKGVNKFDSDWWDKARPVPLTLDEEDNYYSKDLFDKKSQSKPYRDSVQRETNKFKPIRYALVGQRIENVHTNSYWYFYPLHNTVFYNTVEGWGVRLRARYVKSLGLRRSVEFEPNFRYGFASKTTNANAELTFRVDTLHHASFSFRGGSDFLDLNNRGTVNLFYNTLTTLFEGRNYLKLFRSKFAAFSAQSEVLNGLMVNGGVEIAKRIPMRNSSFASIFDRTSKMTTSNNPLDPTSEADIFPINNAFSVEAKLSYTFGQHYTTRPDGKVYEQARLPTIMMDYRKGIPGVLKSVVDYDFISADIFQDKIPTGLWGYSSFYISAGKFLNTESLYYPDMHHFTGNQTAIYNPLFPNFHFLDFYAYTTNDKFLEVHYEHNFAGRFLSKIPIVRKMKLEEIVGGAYLTQPLLSYHEAYVGLQRLVFRLDYGMSWSPGRRAYRAFRLFYGF
ncbi:DUF5686 and carboxypeptidase regulatory-like domain-containing protein [Arcticibacter svalbardensis]|uniref:DUF5686 and carboxypeptidase regulatory-like domain-containing protein n=1 Tax=Arcticibacter svalbardensis TaxID=1288027 RepID=UPI00058B56C3|nr:DUF5686 and carboxypeptidase regulatory-like domain-containing protein [Arcticibacter svalbardensis]